MKHSSTKVVTEYLVTLHAPPAPPQVVVGDLRIIVAAGAKMPP